MSPYSIPQTPIHIPQEKISQYEKLYNPRDWVIYGNPHHYSTRKSLIHSPKSPPPPALIMHLQKLCVTLPSLILPGFSKQWKQ